MELYTSHWRSPILANVDAQVVGISRGTPRWSLPFKYRKLPALAPDARTWAQEDQEQFEASYTQQLEAAGRRGNPNRPGTGRRGQTGDPCLLGAARRVVPSQAVGELPTVTDRYCDP